MTHQKQYLIEFLFKLKPLLLIIFGLNYDDIYISFLGDNNDNINNDRPLSSGQGEFNLIDTNF
jgi:hypothetical protein